MIDLTERLIEAGHAYEFEGNVYYDVRSFPSYGRLSGNTLDRLQPGHRDLESAPGKRHHADFALWKSAGAGRLMRWQSPWGEGFPGWHIECSAMSMEYLGDRFDVHTGGADLRFPHHEDEIAQSDGATGRPVVSLWVHGGFLQLKDQKMSKSTGNVIRVVDLAEEGVDPLALRLLTFGARYRTEMDFTWKSVGAADRRIRTLRQRMRDWAASPRAEQLSEAATSLDRRFRAAVADDLDMPEAVVVLNEAVSAAIGDGEKRVLLESWDDVLGLDLAGDASPETELPDDIEALIGERDAARVGRDFQRSDEIRARLIEAGYEVMDTPGGTRVRPRR
jgi:cysteinyl-tRNA synthetase